MIPKQWFEEQGIEALLINEWNKLKEFIDDYGASNETLRTNMNILYDLCRNSPICSKFFCTGNGYYLIFYFKEVHNLYYSLVVKENSYLLTHQHPMYDNTKNTWNYENDEQNQEFSHSPRSRSIFGNFIS